jgi:hypothetical protein
MQTQPSNAVAGLLDEAGRLADLLAREPVPLADIAALFDELPSEARIACARSLGGRLQARLFEAAKASAPLTIDDLVPPDTAPMRPVRHFGRNSLPAFRLFEKRFCRPEPGAKRLWGYNHQSMAWLVGPGSMVAYDGPAGEVFVDYREIPAGGPDGWPAPRANDRGLAKLVYGNMVDHLRRVSRHVSIGRAFRPEVAENAWFILCREDARGA